MNWKEIQRANPNAVAAGGNAKVKTDPPVVVKNNVHNFAVKSLVKRMADKGYVLQSDAVHTFGKHTMVFVKEGAR
jgi:hypothetical protein